MCEYVHFVYSTGRPIVLNWGVRVNGGAFTLYKIWLINGWNVIYVMVAMAVVDVSIVVVIVVIVDCMNRCCVCCVSCVLHELNILIFNQIKWNNQPLMPAIHYIYTLWRWFKAICSNSVSRSLYLSLSFLCILAYVCMGFYLKSQTEKRKTWECLRPYSCTTENN